MRPSATGGIDQRGGSAGRASAASTGSSTRASPRGVGQLGLPELRAHREEAAAEAADGQAALEVVRVERPDLVILDLTMPRLDGLCASAALRSDPGWPGPGCWS